MQSVRGDDVAIAMDEGTGSGRGSLAAGGVDSGAFPPLGDDFGTPGGFCIAMEMGGTDLLGLG